jgi:hypothetical protein
VSELSPEVLTIAAEVFGDTPDTTTASVVETPAPTAETVPAPALDESAARLSKIVKLESKNAEKRKAIEQRSADLDRRSAELEKQASIYETVKKEPLRIFDLLGLDPKAFLQGMAPMLEPDYVAKATLEKAELERAELSRRLEEESAERKKFEASLRSKEADQSWEAASADLVKYIDSNSDRYANIVSKYSEDQVRALAYAELTKIAPGTDITIAEAYYRQHGVHPDREVVAEHLESLAKALAEAQSKSGWTAKQKTTATATATTTAKPRTLNTKDSSSRVSPPKSQSQEDLDEASIAILREALRR